jgi:hypothetical protein
MAAATRPTIPTKLQMPTITIQKKKELIIDLSKQRDNQMQCLFRSTFIAATFL